MNDIVEVMARVEVDTSRMIQGFLYGDHHVIRDFRKPPGQQEIFRASIFDCDPVQFAIECTRARRRVEMQAAIAALDAAGFAIVPKASPPPHDVVGVLESLITHTLRCEENLDRFHGLGDDAGSGMSSVVCEARALVAQLKGEVA